LGSGYTPVRNDAALDRLWKINNARQVIYARSELSLPDQLRAVNKQLYPARTPSDIRDGPDIENPDVGPFIAYFDALNCLAERISLRESLPIDEAARR
jgi:hypothetical protein